MDKNNTTTDRQQAGVDVTAKSATERAAAIAVESDQTEFNNCKFLSSQDTLYTNEGNRIYFKNCVIEGETDYIFGGGNVIFDDCQLAWCGYSSGEKPGYITAQKSNIKSELYLFRDCSVVSGDLVKQGKTNVAAGYLGRPWGGADASVTFLNTKLESSNMIVDEGWGEMSGAKPENAKFNEYNTTYAENGSSVDVSKRTNPQLTEALAAAYTTKSMFGDWVPVCYEEKETDNNNQQRVTWAYAQRGTQSDKLSVDSSLFTTEHKLTFTTGTAGKLANTGQTGVAFYYAKIKSSESNGTLRATFHVSEAASKLDNQAGMGIMVMDSLAGDDVKNTSADYLNQAEISALLKNESTGTRIPGMRTYLGNTDLTGKTNASGTCDVTNYFDANATVADVSNVTSLYYNFEMVKDCNGYTFNWYNDDWSEIKGTYTLYNPSKLLKQDKDYVYVGFYATRAGKVEVTNISTNFHEPTEEELAAVDTSKWVDYDTANVKTFNGTSTADEDYTYRFTSNVTGKLTVTDDNGNTYISDKDIISGETVKFNISKYDVKLADGDTTFITTVTPAENSFDFDTMQKEYDDRLLLLDYSPIVVKDTVTKAALNAEDGVVYVGPAGTSDGDGTKSNPYDLQTALKFAKAGQTIIMLDGTYEAKSVIEIPFSVSGTEDNMITLKAENTGKAIIDGSNIVSSSKESVLFVKGSYWHIYGINVTNAADGYKGVHISGNHNVIEMCEMYDNGSTGLQISYSGGEPREWWPAYNTILNCTSYYNCDSAQNDADGFAAKLSVGEGNVFDGCVSYNNADDGYDLYAKEKAGYGPIEAVVIKNSLAYNNGTLKDGSFSKASANGFKLGGEGLTGKHQLINCVSWNNGGSGIMSNNGPDCQVYNCISVDNGLFSRTGGTADRNNYQLTPKNGDKYTGKTAYIIKNSLGFYTEAITNFGTMAADKFTLVGGQSEDEIYTENNYFSVDKSTLKAVNSNGKEVTKDWFKSVDYANITPTRNADGSIDMHGLFELTDNAPEGVGAVISKTDDTTCKEHTWDAGVVIKEATCTEAGEITYTCEVCKETKTEAIAAKGHTYSTEWTVDKEATCTEAGSKSHHCTECDAKTDETEIAAKGHTWGAGVVTKEATCTEAGEITYTCEVCKETKTEAIAAKGHTYSTEWTVDKEATTTETGSKSHHCTVCGDKADITEIPKIQEEKPDDNKTQVDVSVDKGDNAPDMGLTGTKDEIIDSIFTDEEKKNTNGKNVEVILSVANINDNVTDNDRKLIDSVLTPSQRTGIILDITLNVKVDNESKQMYETNKEITISTELPDNLINRDTSVDRKYNVIRIHNGKTDILNAEYDVVTNKLTFATDRFSTYVIVYEDIVKDTTGEAKPGTDETTKQDQNGNTTDSSENTNVTENVTEVSSETSAKTGDTAVSMELLIFVLLLSGVCSVSTFLKRRKYM